MFLMGEAMKPLRSHQPFIDLMREMDNPLLAILVSAAFTGLVQSSSATTAVIILLAKSGFIDQLTAFVSSVSPVHTDITDNAKRMMAETPRQIANAHTTFNVANMADIVETNLSATGRTVWRGGSRSMTRRWRSCPCSSRG